MKRYVLLTAAVFVLIGGCYAQVGEAPEAVVDAARAAKRSKIKAKVVLNDDTIRASSSGIPDVSRTGDNSADIAAAILAYDETHTPAQTEQKAREWYGTQASELDRMSSEIQSLSEESSDQCENADERDVAACERAMQLRAQRDQNKRTELQRAFWHMNSTIRSVRYRLLKKHLTYDWMLERELYLAY